MHTDNRVRAAVRPLDLGWLRPELRYRLRPGGQEWRYGLQAEADRLGVAGLFVRARASADNLDYEDDEDDDGPVDRIT